MTPYRNAEPSSQRQVQQNTNRLKFGLAVVAVAIGSSSATDAFHTYNGIQVAERRIAPVVERADNLLQTRVDLGQARRQFERFKADTEVWAGILRMDSRCTTDGRTENKLLMLDVAIEATRAVEVVSAFEENRLRNGIARYRAEVIDPLEGRLAVDFGIGALLSLGAMISLARKKTEEKG